MGPYITDFIRVVKYMLRSPVVSIVSVTVTTKDLVR